MSTSFVSSDRIHSLFTEAMSQMYRAEVPQYDYAPRSNRDAFEDAPCTPVIDELQLYTDQRARSLQTAIDSLGVTGLQLKPVA